MGKQMSKIRSQLPAGQTGSDEEDGALESPVRGVVHSSHDDSFSFSKNVAFSVPNAASAHFAQQPVSACYHEQPLGRCLNLVRSTSSRKAPENPLSEEPPCKKEALADSGLIRSLSRKQCLDCALLRSPNSKRPSLPDQASYACLGLRSPSRNRVPSPRLVHSQLSSCLFPSRSSVAKDSRESPPHFEVQQQASRSQLEPSIAPCSGVIVTSRVTPLHSGIDCRAFPDVERVGGNASEVFVTKKSDLPPQICSLCRALSCNCHENALVESFLTNLLQQNEKVRARTFQLPLHPEAAGGLESFGSIPDKNERNGNSKEKDDSSLEASAVIPGRDNTATPNAKQCCHKRARPLHSYLHDQENSNMAQKSPPCKGSQETTLASTYPSEILTSGGSFPLATSSTAAPFTRPGGKFKAAQGMDINTNEEKLRCVLKEIPQNQVSISEQQRSLNSSMKFFQEPSGKRPKLYATPTEHHPDLVKKWIEGTVQNLQAELGPQSLAQLFNEEELIDKQMQGKGIEGSVDKAVSRHRIFSDQSQRSRSCNSIMGQHLTSDFKTVRERYFAETFSCQNQGQGQVTKFFHYNRPGSIVEGCPSPKMSMLRSSPKKMRNMVLQEDFLIESEYNSLHGDAAALHYAEADTSMKRVAMTQDQKKRLASSPKFGGKRVNLVSDVGNGRPCFSCEIMTPKLDDKKQAFQVMPRSGSSLLPLQQVEVIFKDPYCEHKPMVGLLTNGDRNHLAVVEPISSVQRSPKHRDVFHLSSTNPKMYHKPSSTTPANNVIQKYKLPHYHRSKSDGSQLKGLKENIGPEQKPTSTHRLHPDSGNARSSQGVIDERDENFPLQCIYSCQATARNLRISHSTGHAQILQNRKLCTPENGIAPIDSSVVAENIHVSASLGDNGPKRPDLSSPRCRPHICPHNGNQAKPNSFTAASEACADIAFQKVEKQRVGTKAEDEEETECTAKGMDCPGKNSKSSSILPVASPEIPWTSLSSIPTSSLLTPEEIAEIWSAFEAIQLS